MGFLSRLGFKLNKVTKAAPDLEQQHELIEDEALKEAKAKRAALYLSDAQEVAKQYATWIKPETLKKLCDNHDFLQVQWGGRKSARLINLCRNILDIVTINNAQRQQSGIIEQHDKDNVLKLLFWAALLYPMTVMWSLKVENVENRFTDRFTQWMKESKLYDEEISLILHMVFHTSESTNENLVVNIFHDALKLEEMQFNFAHVPEIMRTELGKNRVFAAKVKRDCQANLMPSWLKFFQEHLNETRLYPMGVEDVNDVDNNQF